MSYSYRMIFDLLNENGLVYDKRFTKLPTETRIIHNRHFLLKIIPTYKYALFGFCVMFLVRYYSIYPSTITRLFQKIKGKIYK